MNATLRKFWFGGIALLLAGAAHARIWTIGDDVKLDAQYAGMMRDTVFLRKPDGSQVKCKLAALSADDRTFIREGARDQASVVSGSPPPAVARAPSSAAASPVMQYLEGKLVVPGENGFSDFQNTSVPPDYIALYYSAGWCNPCHRFTPRLVSFYRDMKSRHGNFEVIFVSNDHSENDMLGYMREFSMPWPAVRYADIRDAQDITRHAGPGIPCLVILDAQGNVLSDSFVNGEYVGPDVPMNFLGNLLESKN